MPTLIMDTESMSPAETLVFLQNITFKKQDHEKMY